MGVPSVDVISTAVTASSLSGVSYTTTALVNRHNRYDATAHAVTVHLPAGAVGGSFCSIEKTDSSGNSVTATGSASFGTIRATTATVACTAQYQTVEFMADDTGSWWPVGGFSAPSTQPTSVEWEKAVSALAPSATINTYGAVTTWAPDGTWTALVLDGITLVSGGSFGSETLTVKITPTFATAGAGTAYTKTFTAASVTYDLTDVDLAFFFKDADKLISLALTCESNLAAGNSSATCALTGVGTNSN